MDVGVGLPSTIKSATGREILDWAREADAAGFSSLGTIDRIVYGNHETIPTLAAAAAVTSRVRLHSAILIGPFRGNGTLLAKQLASVDSFSGGRLTVGIAVGARTDDYAATGADFEGRGAVFDAQLDEFREVWGGASRGFAGAVGPGPVQPGGPPLMIGGTSAAAIRRTVTHGAGWMAGGGGADMFAGMAERVRGAWRDAGRDGTPRLAALGYYALGPDADSLASGYLGDYYAFLGDYADRIAAGALRSDAAVRDAIGRFADAGCDELILFPSSPDLDQLRRLADLR
ncbi:MAG TPA: LLM class flavin-dependent oxidoreductase [Actinophytocola sp.]|jgi:alkanesulfonate monooxygenase SsuD/methylene tetrahydromethanopterin reductase-like flavin-dependent oxidoreductase (luciferase family)|uniref:LLM class flavin-dependent oxidoreductase n=1 Tax=Actinophytocola sp. TaxID=1872138 RepID=UPI002F91CA4B